MQIGSRLPLVRAIFHTFQNLTDVVTGKMVRAQHWKRDLRSASTRRPKLSDGAGQPALSGSGRCIGECLAVRKGQSEGAVGICLKLVLASVADNLPLHVTLARCAADIGLVCAGMERAIGGDHDGKDSLWLPWHLRLVQYKLERVVLDDHTEDIAGATAYG
jgi:hypothetical protein